MIRWKSNECSRQGRSCTWPSSSSKLSSSSKPSPQRWRHPFHCQPDSATGTAGNTHLGTALCSTGITHSRKNGRRTRTRLQWSSSSLHDDDEQY
jgi:hypothetical protein